MKNIFQSLLLVIAGGTQKELARQVKYLKVENQILRSRLPQRIVCTPKERVRLGLLLPFTLESTQAAQQKFHILRSTAAQCRLQSFQPFNHLQIPAEWLIEFDVAVAFDRLPTQSLELGSTIGLFGG